METVYVVKKGSAYIHAFTYFPRSPTAEWVNEQHTAFRWTDRNGAAMVAKDVCGRVVRLRPRVAP